MRTTIWIIWLLITLIFTGCITTSNKKDIDTEIQTLLLVYKNKPDKLLSELDRVIGKDKEEYKLLYLTVYVSAGMYQRVKDEVLADDSYIEDIKTLKLLAISQIALKENPLNTLDQMLLIDDTNSFALNKKADIYMINGKLDMAEKLLTISYKTDYSQNSTKILLGDLALKRVKKLGLGKKRVLTQREEANVKSYYNLALDYYKLVVDSTDSSYYVKLAEVYKKLGKKSEALTAYNKAIEFDNDNIWSYYDRGKLYFYMGEYQLALPDLKKAYSMDNRHFFTNVFLGRVYFILNSVDESLFHYNVALEINPDYDPAYRDLSVLSYVKGDKQGSLDYQIKLFYKESKRDPFIPLFLVNTLLELNRESEAKKILQKLVKYEKNSTMRNIYNYYLDPRRTGSEVLSSALITDDIYFKTRMSYYISCALYRDGVVSYSEVMMQEVAESNIDYESKLARYKLGEFSE